MARADASGSLGRSVARSPSPGPVFERSTPALAHTNPCRVRLMIRPPSAMRSTSALSRSTSSTWRGSFPHCSPHWRAVSPGSTRGQVDHPTLRLADDLLGHDHHVRIGQTDGGGLRRRRDHRPQVVPGLHLAHPVERDELDAAAPHHAAWPRASHAARSAGVSRSNARPARCTTVTAAPARSARPTVGREAVRAERKVDRIRWGQGQPVRPTTGRVGSNRHDRRAACGARGAR